MMDMKEIRDWMGGLLQEYDKVFVAGDRLSAGLSLFQKISGMTEKNFLLIVSEGNRDAACVCQEKKAVISQEEYQCLEELYYLYEFSDRICLLADDDRYAGLGNYVLSGILTEDEMLTALLGEVK